MVPSREICGAELVSVARDLLVQMHCSSSDVDAAECGGQKNEVVR
jgi:hypothetical protein